MKTIILPIGIIAVLLIMISSSAHAWDSEDWNPTRASHTQMAKYAIDDAKQYFPEAGEYSELLIEGANCELHELKMKDSDSIKQYCPDMEDRRKNRYVGTNPGCEHPNLIWVDALAAYKAGNKGAAYFLLGVLLHQIEDMSVPAHAQNIYHQANPTEFDNFEMMGLLNWKPDFAVVDRRNPKRDDPSAYYERGKSWCLEDAPDYKDRSAFSKTWATASDAEKELLSKCQATACLLSEWALESAMITFERENNSQPANSSTPRQVKPMAIGSGAGRIHRLGTPTSCGAEDVIRIWVNEQEVRTSVKDERDMACDTKGTITVRATVFECLKKAWKDSLLKYEDAKILDESPVMLKWTNPSEGIAEICFEATSETCEWELDDSACKELEYKTSTSSSGTCPVSPADSFTFTLPDHPERAIVRDDTKIYYTVFARVEVKGKRTITRTDGTVKTFEGLFDTQHVTVQIMVPTAPGRPDLYDIGK